jgi:bacillithiol system protein YtxJ
MKFWNILSTIEQLTEIEKNSFLKPQLLFKHSTRCSISDLALNRLRREEEKLSTKVDLYYLDLIRYRDISNEIAARYKVEHESPQVIVLSDGKAIYHASHHMILPDTIITMLK